MQRNIVIASLAVISTLLIVPALLVWFQEPQTACAYRASLARFDRAELVRSPAPGSVKLELSVKYRYTANGREYISERLFCTQPSGMQSQDRIRDLAKAVQRREVVVARWHPTKPAEGCLSITEQFAFNTIHNVSAQCLERE